MSAVEEIVAQYEGQIQASTIWFKPNIPSDILGRALAKNGGNTIAADSVLMLVDDSSRSGFFLNRFENYILLTSDRLVNLGTYCARSGAFFNLADIKDASLASDDDKVWVLHINGNPFLGFFKTGSVNGLEICNILNEISKANGASAVGEPLTCPQEIQDCYRVLDLDATASLDEVKQAWRELAKLYHPDRLQHDPKLQQRGQEKLKKINAAYDALIRYYASENHRQSETQSQPEHSYSEPKPEPPEASSNSRTEKSDNDLSAADPGQILGKIAVFFKWFFFFVIVVLVAYMLYLFSRPSSYPIN